MLGLMLLSIVGLAGAALTLDLSAEEDPESEDTTDLSDAEDAGLEGGNDLLLDPDETAGDLGPDTSDNGLLDPPVPNSDNDEGAGQLGGAAPVPISSEQVDPAPPEPDASDGVLYLGDDDTEHSASDFEGPVYAEGGNDTIYSGFSGAERSEIYGGDGHDTLTDGGAHASLDGGRGNDVIASGHGDATVVGGDGDDHITTGIDTDTIFGGDGDDTIVSFGTQDQAAFDQVFGGDGDDVLQAQGLAKLTGGDGADTFRAYVNSLIESPVQVVDFDVSEDRLEVCIEGGSHLQLDDFDISVEPNADGDRALICVDGEEVMQVMGGQDLTAADIEFKVVYGYPNV